MSIAPEQTRSPHVAIEVLKAQLDDEEKQYSHNQELVRYTDVVIKALHHHQKTPPYKLDLESGDATATVNPAPSRLRFLVMWIFSIFSK